MTPVRTAWIVVLLLFSACAYRAAKAAITTDEAFTYTEFVSKPFLEFATHYTANHHVLHSLLCRVAVNSLPLTEFTLRIPALLGAALTLAGLLTLYRRIMGDVWLLPVAVAFTALHPALFDYLSLARGYGLAMGLWLWGLAAFWNRRLPLAGALFGLAIATNGIFIFPVLAAVAVASCQRFWNVVLQTAVPALVLAFLFVVLPMSEQSESHFYYGVPSLLESARNLSEIPDWPLLSEAALVLAPLLLGAALWRGWTEGRMAAVALLILIAAHSAVGMPYPRDRTGIYWIPLLCLLGFRLLREHRAEKRLYAALGVLALFCAGVFAQAVDPRVFRQWPQDSNNRILARRVHGRVAAAWPLPPNLEFYRLRYHMQNQFSVETWRPESRADIYLFHDRDTKPVPQGFHEVWRDERAGVVAYSR